MGIIQEINSKEIVPSITEELRVEHINNWIAKLNDLQNRINLVITTKSRLERVKTSLNTTNYQVLLEQINLLGETRDEIQTQNFMIETYMLFSEIGQYLRKTPIVYEISAIKEENNNITKLESIVLTHEQLFALDKKGNYQNFISGSTNLRSFSSLIKINEITEVSQGNIGRINKLRNTIQNLTNKSYNLGVIGEAMGQFEAQERKRVTKKAAASAIYEATRGLPYWQGPDYYTKINGELVAIQKKVNTAHLTTLNSCIRQINNLLLILSQIGNNQNEIVAGLNARIHNGEQNLNSYISQTSEEIVNKILKEFNAI